MRGRNKKENKGGLWEVREKASEIVTKCLKEKNLSQSQLAMRMGEDVRGLNQQLHRQSDMKVKRFADVLEHAGYRLEVVENGGIQRVCQEFANQIIETRQPVGYFYMFAAGIYTGIDNGTGDAWTEDFNSYEECMKWLKHEPTTDASGNLHEV